MSTHVNGFVYSLLNIVSTFSDRFNEALEDLQNREPGFKAIHLASELGCSRGTISQWKNGRIKEQPTAPLLRGAAFRLGVSFDWLSENRGPKHGNNSESRSVIAAKDGNGRRPKEPRHGEEKRTMGMIDSAREMVAAWFEITDEAEREALKRQVMQKAAIYRRRKGLKLVHGHKKAPPRK